jgi:hypothetical protein
MTKLVAMTFEEASKWIASQEARIRALEAAIAKLKKARELSAIASATLRDEGIAKNDRIRALETELAAKRS